MTYSTTELYPQGIRVRGAVNADTLVVAGADRTPTSSAAVTTAGTNRAGATQMTALLNVIGTSATSTAGVTLPASATVGIGNSVAVFNAGAAACHVYGVGSDTIDTVAGSTGVVLTNAKRCLYYVTAANTYVSAQLGVISA